MSVIVKGVGGKSSGLYVWGKYNAVIGLGESTNNIALANDGTSIDTYVKGNLYIKEDGTIGIQGEPYSTVAISSVMEGSFVGGMTPVKYCVGVDGSVYCSPKSNSEGSVDNCTAKPVSAVKDTFIEYITNNDENKYPEDGIQGGYYYEIVEDVTPEVIAQTPLVIQILEGLVGKAQGANATADKILEGYSAYVGQELLEGTFKPVDVAASFGFTKYEFGEFTLTADAATADVNHSLGEIPKAAYLITPEDLIGVNSLKSITALSHAQFGSNNMTGGVVIGSSSYPSQYYYNNTSMLATDTTITFNTSSSYKIKAGKTYYYMLLA